MFDPSTLAGSVTDSSAMKRAALAEEFRIKHLHFFPTSEGVLEYGTLAAACLAGPTLMASLKMRCDTSGASYAQYWMEGVVLEGGKLVNNKLVVAGDYVTPARRQALRDSGMFMSFSDASQEFQLDVN